MIQPAPQKGLYRFPKSRHLLRHTDFERVYKQGRRHFARHMTVFYLRREGEPDAAGLRIGFTVGRVLGKAVDRNRMKRVLREAIRLCGLERGIAVDVVVNPKRSLLDADFDTVRDEVERALQVIEKAMKEKPRN